jgi:hypothetical protein
VTPEETAGRFVYRIGDYLPDIPAIFPPQRAFFLLRVTGFFDKLIELQK